MWGGKEHPSILNLKPGHLTEIMQFFFLLFCFSLVVAAAVLAWSRVICVGLVCRGARYLLGSSFLGRLGVWHPKPFPSLCRRGVVGGMGQGGDLGDPSWGAAVTLLYGWTCVHAMGQILRWLCQVIDAISLLKKQQGWVCRRGMWGCAWPTAFCPLPGAKLIFDDATQGGDKPPVHPCGCSSRGWML